MKRLLCFFIFAAALSAQTVIINIAIPATQAKLQDMMTHWTDTIVGPVCTFSAAMDAVQTTVSCDVSFTVANFKAGAIVACEGEPMQLVSVSVDSTGVTPPLITLQRAVQQFSVASPHKSGATIYQLQYANPYTQAQAEAWDPWFNDKVLAPLVKTGRSATLPVVVPTGTVTVTQ